MMESSRTEEVLVATRGKQPRSAPPSPGWSKLELVEKTEQQWVSTKARGNPTATFKSEARR